MLDNILELGAVDTIILVFLLYFIYKFFLKGNDEITVNPPGPRIEKLNKRDMTLEELSAYNGVDKLNICIAVMGKIYDVTRGKEFYGIDGPYGNLAGHDATRALATMDLNAVKDEYDDLSDLSKSDLMDAEEWSDRLQYKYAVVGRLLKPGQTHKIYDKTMHKLIQDVTACAEKCDDKKTETDYTEYCGETSSTEQSF